MRSPLPRFFALAGVLVSGGCGITGPAVKDAKPLTLYVASRTAPCVRVGPQTCLLVKQKPGDEWSFFYSGIEGFTHEPGCAYTLDVLRREVPDPPADGSSYGYRLVRIVERESVPAM